MENKEFEEMLYRHSERVRAAIEPPGIYKEEICVKKNKILILAAAVCLFSVSAFAAQKYFSAGEAAHMLGDDRLAEEFGEESGEWESDGDYKARLLGVTSGENISSFVTMSEEANPERSYAVVAVERTDGRDMTYDDEMLITPLIEGLEPWKYNIYTMHGSYMGRIVDGVLYRIIDFDSIEYFGDRHIYMAVVSDMFFDKDAYYYDEDTGEISVNESYDGTNLLFDVKTDKSKADPVKAEEYLKQME